MSQAPGWYHAQGDPEGTMRYWDGAQWVGEPTTQQPTYAAPGGRVYGGVGERLGARIIDAIIFIIPTLIIAFAVLDADNIASGTNFGFAVISLILGAAYEIGFTTLKGATPGKMILNMKVTGPNGESPPSVEVAAKRWLPAILGVIPGLGSLVSLVVSIASGVMISNDDQNRSVHDRIGGSYVVKTK